MGERLYLGQVWQNCEWHEWNTPNNGIQSCPKYSTRILRTGNTSDIQVYNWLRMTHQVWQFIWRPECTTFTRYDPLLQAPFLTTLCRKDNLNSAFWFTVLVPFHHAKKNPAGILVLRCCALYDYPYKIWEVPHQDKLQTEICEMG